MPLTISKGSTPSGWVPESGKCHEHGDSGARLVIKYLASRCE